MATGISGEASVVGVLNILKRLLLLFFLVLPSVALAQTPLRVQSDQSQYQLGPYITYLEDKQGSLEVDQIQKRFEENDAAIKVNYDESLNLGLSRSIFWIHTEIDFSSVQEGEAENWFVELSYPLLKSVEVYVVEQQEQEVYLPHRVDELGDKNHRNFIYRIGGSQSGKLDIFIRVQSWGLSYFPLTLWKAEALAEQNRQIDYWLGFFFGLIAVMALYNGIVFVVVRDNSYLYCTLYILSLIIFFLVFSGVFAQYYPGNVPFWHQRLPLVSAVMAMAFSIKFVNEFIGYKKISRKAGNFLDVAGVTFLLFAIITFFFPYKGIIPATILIFGFSLILFYLIIASVWRGSGEGRMLFVANSFFLLTIFLFVLTAFGFIAFDEVGNLSLYFGIAIQVVMFSIGLASQVNTERKKRYQALIRENQAVQGMRRIEEKATQEAMKDPLTDLPNRSALERFSREYLENDGKKEALAVIYLHLQSYFEVNHTLGFRSGDLLIEKVANRLNRLAAEMEDVLPVRLPNMNSSHVVRLDSASFVLLLRCRNDKQKCLTDMQHMLGLLNRPITIHDIRLDVKARAGMSFLPEHSTNIFTLVRFAQAAIESSEDERSSVVLYSSVVGQQAARKLKLVNELRLALKGDDLSLRFQPQIDIRENRVVSIEALIRWKHPELGDISPVEFIVLAEQTGLIHEVTDWVINRAVESLLWLMERGIKLKISVNISARDLVLDGFDKKILALFEKNKLKPSLLTLELTETSLMHNTEQGIQVLRDLHQSGVAIAIDDFGAGYSSLAYIKQLPISEIKIDRAYVSQIDSLYSDRVITKSTINLAHEMGARVCAEGVETASSLKILGQFECDLAQGFHIAKPLTKEELLVWMDESRFSP